MSQSLIPDFNNIDEAFEPEDSAYDLGGLILNLGFSCLLGVAATAFFAFMRPRNQIVYNPKTFFKNEMQVVPPTLPENLLGWAVELWKRDVPDMVSYAGLDAAVFVLFMSTMAKVFALCSVVGGILVILHYVQSFGRNTHGVLTLEGASSTAVYLPSHWWVHVTSLYVITAIVVFFLHRTWQRYIRLRQTTYFNSDTYSKSIHSKTIMVFNVPMTDKMMQSDDYLARFLLSQKVRGFRHALWGRDVSSLESVIRERELLILELESLFMKDFRLILPSEGSNVRELPIKMARLVIRIKNMEAEILAARENELPNHFRPVYCGFATFRTVEEAHQVGYAWFEKRQRKRSGLVAKLASRGAGRGGEKLDVEDSFTLRMAPQPHAVLWENLKVSPEIRRSLRRRGRFFVGLLTTFWIIPVFILTSISRLETLKPILPTTILRFIEQREFLEATLESLLAPLVFNLFMAFLPSLLRRITRYQKAAVSRPNRVKLNFGKMYYFYIAGLFIVFSITSTIIQFIAIARRRVDNFYVDGSINWPFVRANTVAFLDAIARQFVDRGVFWINFISLNGPGALPVELAQIFPLLKKWSSAMFRSLTPREELNAMKPEIFDYDHKYAYGIFTATLGLTYCVHHPLILFLVASYFAVGTFVFKYQLTYVHESKHEMGGSLWPRVCQRTLFGLVFGQCFSAVIMWNRGGRWPAYSILLPVLITIFMMYYFGRTFGMAARFIDTKFKVDDVERPGSHSQGTDASRLASQEVEHIPRSARNVVKYNRMLQQQASYSLNSTPPAERYLPPALISDLMVPIVPEHLEHLLSPYFPQIGATLGENGQIYPTHCQGNGLTTMFSTINAPPAIGGVPVDLSPPGEDLPTKAMEATAYAAGWQSPRLSHLQPLPYASPPQPPSVLADIEMGAPDPPNGAAPSRGNNFTPLPMPQAIHPTNPYYTCRQSPHPTSPLPQPRPDIPRQLSPTQQPTPSEPRQWGKSHVTSPHEG